MKAHLANANARLFQDLAADRMLDVLARLDEACQGGKHLLAVAVLVRQQTAWTVADQHDHDRVRAGKPIEPAGPAFAAPTAILDEGGAAAVAAAARVLMPLRQRPRLAA